MTLIWDLSAAFAVALLCGLGVGGGGLFIVYLTLARGTGQIDAQGVNYIFFIAAAVASSIFNLIKHRLDLWLLLCVAACGTAGAIIGSLITVVVDPDLIRKIFGAFLMMTGILIIIRKV